MSYKTILVHLNHEPRVRRLLDVTADIAARFEAHVIGVHAFPAFRLTLPIPLRFAGEIAARLRGAIKTEEEAIKATFMEAMANQPFTTEWRSISSEHRDPADTVIAQARSADLVIASQADPGWQLADILDFPDRLALGAGRPVLMVPSFGRHKGIPGNVAIAWSNRRELARAVADALPLLQFAKRVDLLTVDDGDTDLDAVVAWRARHGIMAKASRIVATEFTTGEEIRVRAIDVQSDHLVMGCYGHSSMRQIALGGVSRYILREVTVPVLLSN